MILLYEGGNRRVTKKMQIFVHFVRDESGVTAIEYSLIAGLISAVCIGAISTIGNALLGFYTAISATLAAAL